MMKLIFCNLSWSFIIIIIFQQFIIYETKFQSNARLISFLFLIFTFASNFYWQKFVCAFHFLSSIYFSSFFLVIETRAECPRNVNENNLYVAVFNANYSLPGKSVAQGNCSSFHACIILTPISNTIEIVRLYIRTFTTFSNTAISRIKDFNCY